MKKILITVCSAMLLSSCARDLMDREPLDIITAAKVWNDASLTEAYLTEAYTRTSIFTSESEYQDRNEMAPNGQMHFIPFMINSVSDESKFNRTWAGNANSFKMSRIRT